MIIFIHGAFASKISFNYLKSQMKSDDQMFFTYECDDNLISTIFDMKEKIERLQSMGHKIDLIGHSLGGVIAMILHHIVKTPLRSLITLSAPFGGITSNPLMKYWFTKSVFLEFHKIGLKFGDLRHKKIEIPHKIFITTTGSNPLFFGKPNDGVVTVDTQKKVNSEEFITVPLNHYEILMSDEVSHDIRDFYRKL